MPTSQQSTLKPRSPKTFHRPAKTACIAPKTALAIPIYPHASPPRPTQMNENERK